MFPIFKYGLIDLKRGSLIILLNGVELQDDDTGEDNFENTFYLMKA